MLDIDVEVQGRPAGLHSRTKPRGCSRRAGPAAEERQGDDQGRQADRKTDRKGGKRELRGGDVPSRRVSPCTLLSYEGSFPSRWPQRREEEGEGGERRLRVFFPAPQKGPSKELMQYRPPK